MINFIVVVFPSEGQAEEGLRQLQALHEEGQITRFAQAMIQRDAKGAVSVMNVDTDGPLGAPVGALIGGLVGLFGGVPGVVVGTAGGLLAGTARDFAYLEVGEEFAKTVAAELQPGRVALVAEVAEEWNAPIDSGMAAVGGKVVRESRLDFADDLLEKRLNARKAALVYRMGEIKSKGRRLEAQFAAELSAVKQDLERLAQKARKRLDEVREELDLKLGRLQDQAAKAKAETRIRVEQRIAELREDFGARQEKLARAHKLTAEALRP